MTGGKDSESRELRERIARIEASGERVVMATPRPPKKKSMDGGTLALLIISGLIVAGGIIGVIGSSLAPSGGLDIAEDIRAQQSAWMPPTGYIVHDADGGGRIGIEWSKPEPSECRGRGVTCFAINLISERDCPRNLYASITLSDAAGRNIGWTNDTAQGVRTNEPTRLVFSTYTDGVESARIAELRCY